MLPKRRRLLAEEVKGVIARGRSLRAGVLSAKYVADKGPLRASAVVSKKVAKRAVDRNRLRRALYQALSEHKKGGAAVVFIQKIPPPPLVPAFRKDVESLLNF